MPVEETKAADGEGEGRPAAHSVLGALPGCTAGLVASAQHKRAATAGVAGAGAGAGSADGSGDEFFRQMKAEKEAAEAKQLADMDDDTRARYLAAQETSKAHEAKKSTSMHRTMKSFGTSKNSKHDLLNPRAKGGRGGSSRKKASGRS